MEQLTKLLASGMTENSDIHTLTYTYINKDIHSQHRHNMSRQTCRERDRNKGKHIVYIYTDRQINKRADRQTENMGRTANITYIHTVHTYIQKHLDHSLQNT